jgi:hypothetical protein
VEFSTKTNSENASKLYNYFEANNWSKQIQKMLPFKLIFSRGKIGFFGLGLVKTNKEML